MLKTAMIFAMSCIVGSAYALTPDSDVCIKRDFSYFQWSTETACGFSNGRKAGDRETAIVFDAYCPSEEGPEYTLKGTAAVMPTGDPDVYWIAAALGDSEVIPYLAGVCDD